VFEQRAANRHRRPSALARSHPLPIALDESCAIPTDLATFVKLDAIDIAIAKVSGRGGLTLSRRLCPTGGDAGLPIMGSGLTDTDLGSGPSCTCLAAFGIAHRSTSTVASSSNRRYVGDTTVS